MSDTPRTVLAAFSRIMLPGTLFTYPSEQDSMLLAGSFSKPFIQHAWREFCKSANVSADPILKELDTTTKWLGRTLASLIVVFPTPQEVGEAYWALFIVPARPEDGPRRYFTLEKTSGPATVLYEWLPERDCPAFRAVVHAEGIKPDLEAFGEAVEKVTVYASQQPAAAPSTNAGPPLLTRYVVYRGKAVVGEAIARESLMEQGLKNCSSMLIGIRGGAADVVRANPRTGEVQSVAFGIPGDLFPQLPAELAAVHRSRPGHLFTVSTDKKPLIINLLVPASDSGDLFAAAVSLLIRISGDPDPAAGDPVQQQRRTFEDIMTHRPALLSVFARWPGDDDKLADVLGFTQHFGAALLLESPPAPAAAPPPPPAEPKPAGFSRWLGKLFGK